MWQVFFCFTLWNSIKWLLDKNATKVFQREKSLWCFTARQRSCVKIMFSVMRVCLSTRGFHLTIIHVVLDLTIQGPPTPALPPSPSSAPPPVHDLYPHTGPLQPHTGTPGSALALLLLVIFGGQDWRLFQTWGLPMLLTSGGFYSTYSRQVVGIHLTGMLPCFIYLFLMTKRII